MNQKIQITVKWSFGEEKRIICNDIDVIEEVLSTNGFENLKNAKLTAIFKGKVINQQLTFAYYGIKDGGFIVCLRKKLPDPSKREKFLAQFSARADALQSYSVKFEERSMMLESQQARTNDLAYNSWEASPQMTKIYNNIYKSQNLYFGSKEVEFKQSKTVIPEKPKEISTQPLPILTTNSSSLYQNHRNRINARSFEPAIDTENKNYNVSMKKD